jgi:hypothetical protein
MVPHNNITEMAVMHNWNILYNYFMSLNLYLFSGVCSKMPNNKKLLVLCDIPAFEFHGSN